MGEEEQQPSISEVEVAEVIEEPTEQAYPWPVICFHVPPHRTYHFYHQFRTRSNPNKIFKDGKWSSDGSGFLTSSEDNTLCFFALPDNDSDGHVNACSPDTDADRVTCVFASTTHDHPIHLWDATSGQLRCTYWAYDAMDEITAAFSIGFNPSGTKILAGYNKSLRVFDIHRPGRDFAHYSTLQGNKEGQSGSCLEIAI